MKLKFLEHSLAMIGISLKGIAPLFGVLPITQFSIVLLFIVSITKKILFLQNISIQKTLFFTFISIFIISFIINFNVFNFDTIKMFLGFVIYMLAYYWYLEFHQNNLQKIIRLYIIIAVMVSVIGLIQQIGYLLDIRYLYDSSFYGFGVSNITSSGSFLRVYSIMVEPTHFATFLLPAVFLAILKMRHYNSLTLVIKKWESLIIVITYILTLSLVSYFSFFIILTFIFLFSNTSKIKKIILVTLSMIFLSSSVSLIPSISEKYISIKSGLEDQDFLTSTSGLSFFALLSNFQVALSSLKENPLLGSGINSHKSNYKKYIENYYDSEYTELNSADASSLYIRLLSEFGVLGFLFFLYILIKFKIKTYLYPSASFYLIINLMSFVSILLIVLRNGQYLNPMIVFLLSLLIITFKKEKEIVK